MAAEVKEGHWFGGVGDWLWKAKDKVVDLLPSPFSAAKKVVEFVQDYWPKIIDVKLKWEVIEKLAKEGGAACGKAVQVLYLDAKALGNRALKYVNLGSVCIFCCIILVIFLAHHDNACVEKINNSKHETFDCIKKIKWESCYESGTHELKSTPSCIDLKNKYLLLEECRFNRDYQRCLEDSYSKICAEDNELSFYCDYNQGCLTLPFYCDPLQNCLESPSHQESLFCLPLVINICIISFIPTALLLLWAGKAGRSFVDSKDAHAEIPSDAQAQQPENQPAVQSDITPAENIPSPKEQIPKHLLNAIQPNAEALSRPHFVERYTRINLLFEERAWRSLEQEVTNFHNEVIKANVQIKEILERRGRRCVLYNETLNAASHGHTDKENIFQSTIEKCAYLSLAVKTNVVLENELKESSVFDGVNVCIRYMLYPCGDHHKTIVPVRRAMFHEISGQFIFS